ncbi:hypothetical protein GCM10008961_19110 [Deinococcus knuensis]|uniref:Uncharacterized protein n=1 Tax=Deinococcus knuensis TaxID=1837380 RepID=A0ABQ2SFZ8_9DEIO|nr:hypothetical protein GCM10008961_19110 [Deinococcus knuensis]
MECSSAASPGRKHNTAPEWGGAGNQQSVGRRARSGASHGVPPTPREVMPHAPGAGQA